MAPFTALERGWSKALGELVDGATTALLVAAPFITNEGSRMIVDRLSPTIKAKGSLYLLTDLNPTHVCDGSLEPSALGLIYDAIPTATLWHIPRLHAKVFVADDERAIVTSGNLTASGLYRNIEYGIDIRDSKVVRTILSHFDVFQKTGATVSRDRLTRYTAAAERLREKFKKQQLSASSEAQKALRDALQEAEDDLVRLRLAGGAMHTVFGRSIGYLLRKNRSLSTVQLHELVQELHPDLCDDSVDRIIDGENFGKKWKHAVRTAQQYLKKRGEITYVDGRWQSLLPPLE